MASDFESICTTCGWLVHWRIRQQDTPVTEASKSFALFPKVPHQNVQYCKWEPLQSYVWLRELLAEAVAQGTERERTGLVVMSWRRLLGQQFSYCTTFPSRWGQIYEAPFVIPNGVSCSALTMNPLTFILSHCHWTSKCRCGIWVGNLWIAVDVTNIWTL